MSHREVWFAGDVDRLREILVEGASDEAQDLGIGFFSAFRAPVPDPGISVLVCPVFLHDSFLASIGKGFLSPMSHEILFFGEQTLPGPVDVRRWLMVGLQGDRIILGDGLEPLFREWPEVAEAQCISEVVAGFLAGIHRKVLELRAGRVVLPAALTWLTTLATAVAQARGFAVPVETRDLVLGEFLAWVAEEFLHPCLIVLPENGQDFARFVDLSKKHFRNSGEDVVLKL